MGNGNSMVKNILVIAGEVSGDIHGKELIEVFHRRNPEIKFWGLGGSGLASAGMEILHDVSELAVMGLLDVVIKYPRLKKIFNEVLCEVKKRKPIGAILIDYPGFNLKMAPLLKKNNIKVGYFVSPQLWAWGSNRALEVRQFIDKMVCILPFEPEFYRQYSVEAEFVGHPFVQLVRPSLMKDDFLKKWNIKEPYMVLLPGSREKEVRKIFPIMHRVVSALNKKYPQLNFVLVRAPQITIPQVDGIIQIDGPNYDALCYARAALVASGSATLECALAKLPSIVLYKTDSFSWFLAKRVAKVRYWALANIIAGEEVFPEFYQKIPFDRLYNACETILLDEQRRSQIIEKLDKIPDKLGTVGAYERAVEIFEKIFLEP